MAADFGGTSHRIYYTGGKIPSSLPVSMWCWFNADDTDNVLMGIADKDTGTNQHRLIVDNTSNKLEANTFNGSSTGARAASIIGTGVWRSAYATWVSSTSRKVSYNNATAVEDTTSAALSASLDRIAIGITADSTPFGYWNGRLAECAVWNVELSTGDRDALQAGCSPLMVRPDALCFYAPLINGPQDLFGATHDESVASYTAHPRIIRPSAQILHFPPAAVGGGGGGSFKGLTLLGVG